MFEQESLQNESMEKYIWNQPLEHPKMVSTKWENTTPIFGQNPARHKMMVYAGHVPTHFMPEISRGCPYCLRYIQQGEFKKKMYIYIYIQSASVILKFSRLQGGLYNQRFFLTSTTLDIPKIQLFTLIRYVLSTKKQRFCNEVLVEPLS